MPAANTTNAGAELKLAGDATGLKEPCKPKMRRVRKIGATTGGGRCAYETTNKTNKPNNTIDTGGRAAFNRILTATIGARPGFNVFRASQTGGKP